MFTLEALVHDDGNARISYKEAPWLVYFARPNTGQSQEDMIQDGQRRLDKAIVEILRNNWENNNLAAMHKYSFFGNEQGDYTIVHSEDEDQTYIAITDTAEKAHFIVSACNDFNQHQR